MGQKINSNLHRQYITIFNNSQWFTNNLYSKFLFEEYQIKLYLICILKKLNIQLENLIIKRNLKNIFIYIRIYYSIKRFIRFKKKKEKRKIFKGYFLRNFRKIFRFLKKKRKLNLKKNTKLLLLFLQFKLKKKKNSFYLKKIIKNLKIIIKYNFKFFIINLNKFLKLTFYFKNLKIKFFNFKLYRFKKFKYFYDIVYTTNIALFFKNAQFILYNIKKTLKKLRLRFYKNLILFFFKEMFYIYKLNIYNNLIGYCLKISGKLKTAKKDKKSYLKISSGYLSLMSFNIVKFGFLHAFAQKSGVVGLKCWLHYKKKYMSTINQLLKNLKQVKIKKNSAPALNKCPQKKGVCLKIFDKLSPRKPNSANRKGAKVKLSNKKKILIYIPGQGHLNIKEHSAVLVAGKGAKDLPGVNYHAIRGKLDLNSIPTRKQGRSKYGTKKN